MNNIKFIIDNTSALLHIQRRFAPEKSCNGDWRLIWYSSKFKYFSNSLIHWETICTSHIRGLWSGYGVGVFNQLSHSYSLFFCVLFWEIDRTGLCLKNFSLFLLDTPARIKNLTLFPTRTQAVLQFVEIILKIYCKLSFPGNALVKTYPYSISLQSKHRKTSVQVIWNQIEIQLHFI